MNPQTATAMQPVKAPVPIKQSATDDVFDRVQRWLEEHSRSLTLTVGGQVMNSRIGTAEAAQKSKDSNMSGERA